VTAPAEHPSISRTLREISRPVWLVLVGMLVNRLGNFLQIYLVLFLTAKGFSAAAAGLALGAYGVGSVIGVLAGGSVSDRIGYRWTIVGSMLACGVLTASFVYLTNLAVVLVVAATVGAAAQAYRPASSALLVELTPANQHVMVFAVYRLAFNLGTTAGPLLGALLITYSYNLMFYADALTSICFGLLALTLPRRGSAASTEAKDGDPRRSYLTVLADRRYTLFLLALFINAAVYIQHISVLPVQLTASGHSTAVYAALLSLNAFVVICLELPFTRWVQRMPARLAVAIGVGLVGVGMNLYVAGPVIAMIVAATLVWTLGEMIGTPTASAYPGQVAPPTLRGRYIAALAFAQQIGYAAGPPLGLALWAVWPAGVWWACGLFTVVAVAAVLAGMPNRAGSGPTDQVGEPADRVDEPADQIGKPANPVGKPADQAGEPADAGEHVGVSGTDRSGRKGSRAGIEDM
jgi:predicted MFS family arabinose efflux permease